MVFHSKIYILTRQIKKMWSVFHLAVQCMWNRYYFKYVQCFNRKKHGTHWKFFDVVFDIISGEPLKHNYVDACAPFHRLWEGNVFTGVCSQGGRGTITPKDYTPRTVPPPRNSSPWTIPPPVPPVDWQAGSTHPIGICLVPFIYFKGTHTYKISFLRDEFLFSNFEEYPYTIFKRTE